MKFNIVRLLGSMAFMAALLIFAACSSDVATPAPLGDDGSQPHVYRLRLSADIQGFQGSTRAAAEWTGGSTVCLQLSSGGTLLPGVATYNAETEEWTVSVSGTLAEGQSGRCEAYYFAGVTLPPPSQGGAGGGSLSLSPDVALYEDVSATFSVEEDNVIAVTATLRPMTGRVRFVGQAGTAVSVSGLSVYTAYNPQTNSFTSGTGQLNTTVGSDGSTGYLYARFADADKRQMSIAAGNNAAWQRSYGAQVLAKGQSGYITLPTDTSHDGWTLVNPDNGNEITLPTLSAVTMNQLRSKSVAISATVTSVGNGTLNRTGFVWSATSAPTLANGSVAECGTLTQLSTRLKDLTPETTYYVRAFATNQRGTAYGDVLQFKTISEAEDGSNFGLEDYGDDEDLNGRPSSTGMTVGTEGGYGNDDSLDGNAGSGSSGVGIDGYGSDDNLNQNSTGTSSAQREVYGDDEDWN